MSKLFVYVDNTDSKVLVQPVQDIGRNREQIHAYSPRIDVDEIADKQNEYRDMGRGDGGWKDIEIVSCSDEDLPIVIESMTKAWPGKEVWVCEATKVFSRAVGDVVEKSVSESGVLPF